MAEINTSYAEARAEHGAKEWKRSVKVRAAGYKIPYAGQADDRYLQPSCGERAEPQIWNLLPVTSWVAFVFDDVRLAGFDTVERDARPTHPVEVFARQ